MAGSSPRAEGPEDTAMRVVLSSALGSSGDRSGTTPGEIVAPQRDGKGDDGEPGYNDRPRRGTKPLEPLCVELDRTEDCRIGDDLTAVGVGRPSPPNACWALRPEQLRQ